MQKSRSRSKDRVRETEAVERVGRERAVLVRTKDERGIAADREVPPDLERLAYVLDRVVRLPGNFRIGLDGLVGLIPGIGDAVGAFLGFYIVTRASALGLPKAVLARMLLNVGVDTAVGAVPLLGDLFDFAFKANTRNLELMRRALADGEREKRVSALVLGGVVLVVLLFSALVVALGILIARLIASAF